MARLNVACPAVAADGDRVSREGLYGPPPGAWTMLTGALALLLAAAALPGVLAMQGPLDACGGTPMEVPAMFAPLTNEYAGEVNSDGATCYNLFPVPSFPFRGTITVTLTDGSATATARQTCWLSGVAPLPVPTPVPLVGCDAVSGFRPDLAPGPMTLRCVASGIAPEPVALGSWGCGYLFGTGP